MSRAIRSRTRSRLALPAWAIKRPKPLPLCYVAAQGIFFPAVLALILAVVGCLCDARAVAWIQWARTLTSMIGGLK